MYLRPRRLPTQPGSRLIRQLVGFERAADVPAGGVTTLPFSFGVEELALIDAATGDRVSAPGSYVLELSDGSGAAPATVPLTLSGAQVVLEPFPSEA